MYADWEKGGVCIRVCMCVWFMIWDMFFIVRSNDSFNFPLGLIKYIVIVVVIVIICMILRSLTMLTSSKVPATWAVFGSGQWRGGRDWGYHDHPLWGSCHVGFLWFHFQSVERWSGLGLQDEGKGQLITFTLLMFFTVITSSEVPVTWALFGSGQWRGGQGWGL